MAAAAGQAAAAQSRFFATGQPEQGCTEADLQAAETFFAGCTDRQCLQNIAVMQYRQLQKVRPLEKQVRFMERRQDSSSCLPDKAPLEEREGEGEGERERERETETEGSGLLPNPVTLCLGEQLGGGRAGL